MSTRKRHSAQKQAKVIAPNSFKVGDCVKVKPGIKDPDDETRSLGGWQGRINELEDELVKIVWDSLTLKAMPDEMIDYCEEEGLDWATMWLGLEDVEPAESRDTPTVAARTKKKIGGNHAWAYLGQEGQRIQRVLKEADPEDEMEQFETWHSHLTERLTFPFEAEISEAQDRGPLRDGDRVKVTGLNDHIEDMYGLFADLRVGHRKYNFPLCDLEVIDKISPNYQPVKDYAIWFANR